MDPNTNPIQKVDRRVILSTLWIFAMFNYLYADVFTLFFNPTLQKEATRQLEAGYVGGVQITQEFILVFAVLMETAIAMVLLSRILNYPANRWTNIIAGVFHTAFVGWSLIGDTWPNLFYAFFTIIEVACTLFIVWYAWTWPNPKIKRVDNLKVITRTQYMTPADKEEPAPTEMYKG